MIRKSLLYKSLFGYDIFISYSRKDGLEYAYAISQHFITKGYECYIDQLSNTSPGRELPASIQHAVVKSTAFVFVGSTASQASEPIEKEIELFLSSNKNKPIIPININGAISASARWFNHINGLAFVDDSEENVKNGTPSIEVLNRIENSLTFTKKSVKLRRIALTTLFAVFILAGTLTGTTIYQVNKATLKVLQADSLAKSAKAVADSSNAVASDALRRSDSAQFLKKEADSLRNIALIDKWRADSLKNISAKMAKANGLASRASEILPKDPTASLLIAREAFQIYKTPETSNALLFAYISPYYMFSKTCAMAQPFHDGNRIALLTSKGDFKVIDWNGNALAAPKINIKDGADPTLVLWKISSDDQALIINPVGNYEAPQIVSLATGALINLKFKFLDKLIKEAPDTKSLQVSNDGRKYAVYSNGKIIIYSINEHVVFSTIDTPGFNPLQAAFSSDDKELFIWNENSIFVIDIDTRKTVYSLKNQNNIKEVTLSNSLSQSVITQGKAYKFNYFTLLSGDGFFLQAGLPSKSLKKIDPIPDCFIFSGDDSEILYTDFRTNNTSIISPKTLHPQKNLLGGHLDEVLCGSFSVDSKLLVTGGLDNIAVIWEKNKKKFSLRGHVQPIKQSFFSRDSRKVLTTAFDNTIKIWDLNNMDYPFLDNASIRYNEKKNAYEYKVSAEWQDMKMSPEFIASQIDKLHIKQE